MKRFGAHFLGREHRPEGEVPAWALPKPPSSGPQPKTRHPKVHKSSRLVRDPAQSLGGTHSVGIGGQTCTGSVWFICSRMSCILLRIFFWWPAKVTPIRSRSLQMDEGQGQSLPSCPSLWAQLRIPCPSLPNLRHTHSAVIWATRSKDANPALIKLSLYRPILIASSQSPTVVKVV